MSENQMSLPVAKGVFAETSPDGNHTALVFKVSQEPGTLGVALPRDELARTVSLLISKSADFAAKGTPTGSVPERFETTPIEASELMLGAGGSANEYLLGVRVGNLDLTFRVPSSVLHKLSTAVQTQLKPSGTAGLQ